MTGLGSSCGACKFLRRRCTSECVFAPYFCYEQAASHFAAVHKVFGASNVSKLLLHLPVYSRSDAAIMISYEALSRMQDPIYGCVAHIFALQQQVAVLKEEIEMIETQMTNLGFGISSRGEFQDAISNNPYFVAQSGVSENSSNQMSPSMLPSGNNNALVDEACCNHMELQYEDAISQAYLDSSILERLLEEVNQDYCVHALD